MSKWSIGRKYIEKIVDIPCPVACLPDVKTDILLVGCRDDRERVPFKCRNARNLKSKTHVSRDMISCMHLNKDVLSRFVPPIAGWLCDSNGSDTTLMVS